MVKEGILSLYETIKMSFPTDLQILPPLILASLLITFYGIFVWSFYRFIAQRDLIRINLKKYNVFEMAWLVKSVAILFYTIEFIILIPFVIFFCFIIFSILLILIVNVQEVSTILLISAAVIGAIRITSYFKEDLSRDLAKLIPFTLLSIAILTPGFFNMEQILTRLLEIPTLFGNMIYYAVFIFIIEAILRLFFLAYETIISSEPEEG